MKKFLLSAAILFIGAVTASADEDWDWPNYNYYADANAELLKNKPDDPRRVIFFGNSITEGWPIHRPELFTENGFIGRGISGQTTYHFLLRFIEDVIKLKPAAVVICAAGNDVAENTCPYKEERSFNNIVGLIDMAQAHGIKVILTSVLARDHWLIRQDRFDECQAQGVCRHARHTLRRLLFITCQRTARPRFQGRTVGRRSPPQCRRL